MTIKTKTKSKSKDIAVEPLTGKDAILSALMDVTNFYNTKTIVLFKNHPHNPPMKLTVKEPSVTVMNDYRNTLQKEHVLNEGHVIDNPKFGKDELLKDMFLIIQCTYVFDTNELLFDESSKAFLKNLPAFEFKLLLEGVLSFANNETITKTSEEVEKK